MRAALRQDASATLQRWFRCCDGLRSTIPVDKRQPLEGCRRVSVTRPLVGQTRHDGRKALRLFASCFVRNSIRQPFSPESHSGSSPLRQNLTDRFLSVFAKQCQGVPCTLLQGTRCAGRSKLLPTVDLRSWMRAAPAVSSKQSRLSREFLLAVNRRHNAVLAYVT